VLFFFLTNIVNSIFESLIGVIVSCGSKFPYYGDSSTSFLPLIPSFDQLNSHKAKRRYLPNQEGALAPLLMKGKSLLPQGRERVCAKDLLLQNITHSRLALVE
jgi:hypothetical protein